MAEMDEIKRGNEQTAIIPFAASSEWYAAWWEALRKGVPLTAAIAEASASIATKGKDFARTCISGNTGSLFLSIPIVGGAATLKKAKGISNAVLSDHGNWRHTHLGALEAVYGRAPFYQHLMPMLHDVYTSQIRLLSDFNAAIHEVLCGFLGIGERDSLFDYDAFAPQSAIALRGMELSGQINFRHSIIEAIMHHGRETILALLNPVSEPK